MIYTAALIGCGRIGFSLGFDKKREQPASHTMALLKNRSVKIVAGCDTNQKNLLEWQNYTKTQNIFSLSQELYKKIRPDIAILAVDEKSHLQEALCAIENGVRLVILEKPVALNSFEALKIQCAAEKKCIPVMVNHERRFSRDYILAKKFLAEKKIGELQSISARLCSSLCVYSFEREKTGAYSLLHDGTHLVDAVRFFLDDCEFSEPILGGIQIDGEKNVRNFFAAFSCEKCADIKISINGKSRFFDFSIELLGTHGRISIGNGFFSLETAQKSKLYSGFYSLAKKRIRAPKKTRYFSNMLQNAIDFLDGKEKLKSPLSIAIEDLKILEKIKSAF